jgi:lipopolysaccharide heptosyltransferase I
LPASLIDYTPRKILVIKPSALGDVVHSLPFLSAIRKRYGDAEIHWLIARSFEDLLRSHPMISRLWVIDKDRWKRLSNVSATVRSLRVLMRQLRAERYDLVVDLQGLFRSGLLCGATRSPVRVGFREGREASPLFYSHRIRGGRDCHAIERYMKVARSLGADADRIEYPFGWDLSPSHHPANLPYDYVVMAPAAGGEAKRWPAERFGQLASRLPWPSVVISGRSDAHLVEQVVAASSGRALSLAGKTSLREAAAVIRRARAFISNDTGPMHIAAALGVPVFAVFGPTSAARTGPYGPEHTIITARLACSPCYRRKRCSNWICMEKVSVDRVLRSIEARLGSGADSQVHGGEP